MKLFIVILSGVGAYFALGRLVHMVYQSGIDIPMVEVSSSIVIALMVLGTMGLAHMGMK